MTATQYLDIVARLLPDVRAGRKRHTIRWGERVIVPGPLCYINEDDSSDRENVWVTEVKKMPLSEVAYYLGMTAQWPAPVLLAGMREHYPQIQMESEVDVIWHLSPTDSQQLLIDTSSIAEVNLPNLE